LIPSSTRRADFLGTDTFSYVVSDGFGGFATTTLTINVVNSAPVAVADVPVTICPRQKATFTGASLVANDTDADGDPLLVTQFFPDTTQGGSVSITAFDTFEYTPKADFLGTDTFSYVVSDGFGGFATTTLTIHVVNSAPVAVADAPVTIRPGQKATFTGASLVGERHRRRRRPAVGHPVLPGHGTRRFGFHHRLRHLRVHAARGLPRQRHVQLRRVGRLRGDRRGHVGRSWSHGAARRSSATTATASSRVGCSTSPPPGCSRTTPIPTVMP
jgi:hypothetical protein